VGNAPALPSSITQSPYGNVCPSQSGITYTVTNVTGVTYNWTVPAGWTITAGQGSNSITVTAGSAGGNVSVTPSTTCGGNGTTRTLNVTVQGAPLQPYLYTYDPRNNGYDWYLPVTTACLGQTVNYIVPAYQNTTSCNWSVPAGWTITSDGYDETGGYMITVTAGSSGGNITATPYACGSIAGTPATLAVTASACGATCGGGNGTLIAGTCWAHKNAAAFGTFAASADMYTEFYQFNRTKAWSPSGNVGSLPSHAYEDADWHVDSSPCPAGWRLPTRNEYNALFGSSVPMGGTWVIGGYRGVSSSINGRFFGPNYATCTISDLSGCVFLPAVGYRYSNALEYQGIYGFYYSATQYSSSSGYNVNFTSTDGNPDDWYGKDAGLSVRCVQ